MKPFKPSDLKYLERIFAREIEGGLLQSKAKRFAELAELGYCVRVTKRLGVDRFGPIEVSGYALTILGNFTYCMSC